MSTSLWPVGSVQRAPSSENGRLPAGSDDARAVLSPPGERELIVTGAEFALAYLGRDAVDEIRSPELLISHGVRRVTKVVLFPVRFLYRHFIADHITRLDVLGETELADAFRDWQQRLDR